MKTRSQSSMSRGNTGLINLGNTCYLNSCIQILRHCTILNDTLDRLKLADTIDQQKPEFMLLHEYNELRQLLAKQVAGDLVSPKRFVHTVQNVATHKGTDNFTGFSQNDLSEFLMFLLDCMHMGISREANLKIPEPSPLDPIKNKCLDMLKGVYAREYSEIMQIFYGIHVSEIRSQNELLSFTPEQYNIMTLNIPYNQPTTLTECLRNYTSVEGLIGDNAWFNEKTGSKEDVTKQLRFYSLPMILIIVLKRFNSYGMRKNNTLIDYPITGLDLSEFTYGYNRNTVYDLVGVCCHYGTLNGGHYTALVASGGGQWMQYNDEHITGIPKQSVVCPQAYCLFYQMRFGQTN
jgi:ubiquitin carboxyl-terminal hydrolase 2/21